MTFKVSGSFVFFILLLANPVFVLGRSCPEKNGLVSALRFQEQTPKVETGFSADVDKVANECLKNQHLPGLAIVVVVEGRTILKRGYGVSNVEGNIPVDPDRSVFRIGSISKALTFLTLTRMVDDGRIQRDDPVEKYIGSIANPRKFESPVTIDHLLTHTAGFDQIGTDRQIHQHELSLDQRKALRPGLSEFLNDNNLRRVTGAGEMYRYDTYGTTLAGAIIEKVTGKPFAVAMKEEMFDRLGMNQTNVEASKEQFSQLATGYGWIDGRYQPQPYEVYVTTPASSIDATIGDMGRLLEALTYDGANSDGRLFSAAMNERVLAPQYRAHPEFPGITHGMFESYTSDEAGTETHLRTVGHGGTMRGFRSAMTIVPDKKIGVFITANRAREAGGGEVNFRPLLKVVLDSLFEGPKRAPIPVPEHGTVSLDQYEGDYYYGVFCHAVTADDLVKGAWRRPRPKAVVISGDGLKIGGQEFVAIEEDLFVQADGQRMVVFGRDATGKISSFTYSTSPDTFERASEAFPYPDIHSLAQATVNVAGSGGVEEAIEISRQVENPKVHHVSEDQMNHASYQLLQAGQNQKSLAMLNRSSNRLSTSWSVNDRLGAAYATLEDSELAISKCQKSGKLDADSDAGRTKADESKKAK